MPWFYFPFEMNKNMNKYRILIPDYFNVITCIDGYSEFYKFKNKWFRSNYTYRKLLTFEYYVNTYCRFIKGYEFPVYVYEKFNIV